MERSHFSTSGITNAAVFPDPVRAIPTTSCPARIRGIAFRWIGVGSVYPFRFTALRFEGLRPIVSAKQCRVKALFTQLAGESLAKRKFTIRALGYSWFVPKLPGFSFRRLALTFAALLPESDFSFSQPNSTVSSAGRSAIFPPESSVALPLSLFFPFILLGLVGPPTDAAKSQGRRTCF